MIYEATKPEDIPAHGRLLGVKLLHDLSNLVEDNIDPQHTPGSEDERTAIEVAYYSRASYHGYDGYVTSHPDADSLGAIALLTDKRFLNMGISKRVERIADGEAFRSVEPDMMFYAINQMCMNQCLPLAERLECMRAYLFEGTIPPQIENS